MSRKALLTVNPFLREGLRVYFADSAVLRAYVIFLALLAGLLVFAWPRGPVADLLAPAPAARTLAVAAVGAFAAAAWLGARAGAEDYSPGSFTPLDEYSSLTRQPLLRALAGKLVLGILHTVFLLALVAPFLLASLGVSAAPPGAFPRILLVVGCASFACRAMGLLLLVLLGTHALVRDVVMLSAVLAFTLASMALAPAANPVSAILGLAGAADLPARVPFLGAVVPFHGVSVFVSLAAAAAFTAAAAVRLGLLRRAGRSRA